MERNEPGEHAYDEIRSNLETIRWHLKGSGFIRISGFPISESLESTAEELQCFARTLGKMVPQSPDGSLVGVLGPGSEEWHAEQPFHVDGARMLILLCIRPAWKGGATKIVPSKAICDEVRRSHAEAYFDLRESWPFSRKGRPGHLVFNRQIIGGEEGDESLFFLPNTLREGIKLSGDGRPCIRLETVILLEELINRSPGIRKFMLMPGDLMLVDNHKALHARDAYQDDPSGLEKRLLLRCWVEPVAG